MTIWSRVKSVHAQIPAGLAATKSSPNVCCSNSFICDLHLPRPAINYYLNMVYPHDHEDETASRFANERYHANIQNDGTFSVIPQMRGGVTDADQLIQLDS